MAKLHRAERPPEERKHDELMRKVRRGAQVAALPVTKFGAWLKAKDGGPQWVRRGLYLGLGFAVVWSTIGIVLLLWWARS